MDESPIVLKCSFGTTAAPDSFYSIPSHEHACAELLAAVRTRAGLIALIGESGTGKTTVLRHVTRDVEEAGGRVLWWNVAVPFDEMAAWLLRELGAVDATPPGAPRAALLAALQDHLRRGSATMVAVDEAQYLEPAELRALGTLADAKSAAGAPPAVLLAGQPELDVRLARPDWDGSDQVSRVVLSRLPPSEVASYVACRLAQTGVPQDFQPDAIERVSAYAEGIPRVINHLCDEARRATSQAGAATVDVPTVDAAARLQGLSLLDQAMPEVSPRRARPVAPPPRARGRRFARPRFRVRPRTRVWSLGLSVAALGLLASAFFTFRASPPRLPPAAPPVGPAEAPEQPSTLLEVRTRPVDVMPATPPTPSGRVDSPTETGPKSAGRRPSASLGARREPASRAASPTPVPSAAPAPSKAGSALVDAAEAGNLTTVATLLSAGAPADARDVMEMTPLMVAVVHDHTAVVELLLARGANVNARDDGGVTALMLAANNGRVGLLERLLRHGANVNVQTRSGWTALMYATWTGRPDVARRLLAAGANPAATDRKGWTALEYARWRAVDITRAGDDADPLAAESPEPPEIVYRRYAELVSLLSESKTR